MNIEKNLIIERTPQIATSFEIIPESVKKVVTQGIENKQFTRALLANVWELKNVIRMYLMYHI